MILFVLGALASTLVMASVPAHAEYQMGHRPLAYFAASPVGLPSIAWPGDLGFKLLDWQISYEVTDSSVKIGGWSLSADDRQFQGLSGAQCRRVAAKADADQDLSQVRFCATTAGLSSAMQNARRTGGSGPLVFIEETAVERQGVLLAGEGQRSTMTVVFANGRWAQLHLELPHWRLWNLRAQGDALFLTTSSERAEIGAGRGWMASSYPQPLSTKELRLSKQDGVISYQTVMGISAQRFYEVGDGQVPALDSKATFSKTYRAGPGMGSGTRDWLPDGEGRRRETLVMPPGEIGIRGSALLPGEGLTLLSTDLTFLYFHENLFGAASSHLRWGWKLRSFQTVSSFGGSDEIDPPRLGLTSLELRWNARPGLWNVDELWGVMATFADARHDASRQMGFGAGLFWARSMPEGLDSFFRKASFFRHPKYLDFDISYAPVSVAGEGIRRALLQVNAHGKMMFPSSWFFEMGVSLISYEMEAQPEPRGLSTFLGSLGFGRSF